jgi:hypothetical protein
MSPTINDGGPAGMSLRDWFAGRALAGMAAGSYWGENFQVSSRWRGVTFPHQIVGLLIPLSTRKSAQARYLVRTNFHAVPVLAETGTHTLIRGALTGIEAQESTTKAKGQCRAGTSATRTPAAAWTTFPAPHASTLLVDEIDSMLAVGACASFGGREEF